MECYCLLIIGCEVCCVVIGILLLESFRSSRYNALPQCVIIVVV